MAGMRHESKSTHQFIQSLVQPGFKHILLSQLASMHYRSKSPNPWQFFKVHSRGCLGWWQIWWPSYQNLAQLCKQMSWNHWLHLKLTWMLTQTPETSPCVPSAKYWPSTITWTCWCRSSHISSHSLTTSLFLIFLYRGVSFKVLQHHVTSAITLHLPSKSGYHVEIALGLHSHRCQVTI